MRASSTYISIIPISTVPVQFKFGEAPSRTLGEVAQVLIGIELEAGCVASLVWGRP